MLKSSRVQPLPTTAQTAGNPDARTDARTRTWAEINLRAMVSNACLLAQTGDTLMAVVKADAYGHGAAPVSRAAEAGANVGHFGVACLSEVRDLRQAKIKGDIYTLSPFLPNEAGDLVRNDAVPFVSSWEQIAALEGVGRSAPFPARCVLTLDTGMGREGFGPNEGAQAWHKAQTLSGVQIVGLATHFSCADEPEGCENETETDAQTQKFAEWVRFLQTQTDFSRLADGRGNRGIWLSLCNSPGVLRANLPPDLHTNPTFGIRGVLSRPGLLLYGIAPHAGALDTLPGLRPVLAWRAKILLVRDLPEGASVGYGKTHTLARASRIATVGAGYADGLPRRLGNVGRVLMDGGGWAHIVGRVSMDQCQIDVTDFGGTSVGDTVTLIGKNETAAQSVWDLAQQIDTTPHEIPCGLGNRVPRLVG